MKILTALIAFVAITGSCLAEAAVSVTQDGQSVTISGDSLAEIEKHTVALLISCDYEASSAIATKARWKSALEGGNIHIVFPTPRKLSFKFSTTGPTKTQEILVKEILVSISPRKSPDYIFIKYDDEIRAFAKYHNRDALLALQKSLTEQ